MEIHWTHTEQLLYLKNSDGKGWENKSKSVKTIQSNNSVKTVFQKSTNRRLVRKAMQISPSFLYKE